MANSSPPPGTADIFPEEAALWRRLEETARTVFGLYGYGELRTPVFEYTEVFKRGIGDQTEVVQKEMYSFDDRGGRSLTLRPEGTAGIMRALLGTDVMNGNEKRVFYMGPMFRGERPAAGRRRQFHQVGVENAGRVAPELDAECIAMLMHYLRELGIPDAHLLINTRGAREDRKQAEATLRDYFSKHIGTMCNDCKTRLDKNIWRILDCKQHECRKIIDSTPEYITSFSQESQDYFKRVCAVLDTMGIQYKVDPLLVRGLDYYVHTVFEVIHSGLGAQNAISGGGRYELFLPEENKPMVGVGFGIGLERLLMVQEALKVPPPANTVQPVFLLSMGAPSRDFNLKLAADLRAAGIPTAVEVEEKSMKAQMRSANKVNANYVIICGDAELEKGIVVCKEMKTGTQTEFTVGKLLDFLKNIVNNS